MIGVVEWIWFISVINITQVSRQEPLESMKCPGFCTTAVKH